MEPLLHNLRHAAQAPLRLASRIHAMVSTRTEQTAELPSVDGSLNVVVGSLTLTSELNILGIERRVNNTLGILHSFDSRVLRALSAACVVLLP